LFVVVNVGNIVTVVVVVVKMSSFSVLWSRCRFCIYSPSTSQRRTNSL